MPKAKAAAIAYKEREKGRAVATAANVSGAVWETTVYPLPYNSPVEVAIQIVCELDADLTLHLPLTFAHEVETISVSTRTDAGGVAATSNVEAHTTIGWPTCDF